jgi:hypothetical protein
LLLLIFKISAPALDAVGANEQGLCCLVASKAAANVMFVEKYMNGEVMIL